MSLSVGEKVRVVARPRRARRALHRGRLPELQPEGGRAVRAARRASSSSRRRSCAFGMTRRRDVARRGRRGAARRWSSASRRSSCLVGKTWGLHLEKVTRVSRRGEPGDDRRLGRLLPRAGQAGGLRRRALLRRLPRRPRLRARVPARRGRRRAPRTSPSATPTARSLPDQVAEATAAVVADARRRGRGRHPHPQRRRVRASPTRSPRSRPGARLVQGTINGYGERCGNANLVSILPALQLKMGFEVRHRRSSSRALTETAHFVDELCNLTPDPDAPYVGRNAFAHKGGMHVAGVAGRRPHLRAHRPGGGRQQPRRPALGALRQGDDPQPAPSGPGSSSTTDAAERAVERLKEREHRGYHYEAAPTPPSSCCCAREAGELRAAVPSSRASG